MICSPNWKKIKIFNNDLVINRPDIVAKVFHRKVKEYLNEVDKSIFGRYGQISGTFEFENSKVPQICPYTSFTYVISFHKEDCHICCNGRKY